MRAPVAFLLLGETLLVPHLLPIALALARLRPNLAIDLWIGSDEVAALVRTAMGADAGGIRLRSLPRRGGRAGKLATLARLAPHLLGTRVAVCAERTSLWLPALLPLRTRFIKTHHGAGSVQVRTGARRRAAWVTLVPGAMERAAYLSHGYRPEAVIAVGYVKASFPRRGDPPVRFPDARPVLLYAPHWQRHRSSWWTWGPRVVALLAAQRDFNVVLAPHERLAACAPEMPAVLAAAAALPHVRVVLGGPGLVDGSLLDAADLYLGDTSSQVVEFLARPRPCLFLNPAGLDWRARDDRRFWACGDVVDRFERLWPSIERARDRHPLYREEQRRFVADALGDTGPEAPVRAAEAVLAALAR